jgi:hypothetical protein
MKLPMKRAVILLLGLILIGLLAAGWFAVKIMRPEWLSRTLRAELAALPVGLGQADEAAVRASFGRPTTERRGADSFMLQYPGISLRLAEPGMKLQWVEVTSADRATGKGVRVGYPWLELMSRYGRADEVTPFKDGFRYRYRWGMRYTLDFWVNNLGQITKYQFWLA